MQGKLLFSVVIAHYNQMKTVKESIDSVLMQNYENIEIIIADDCSPIFNAEELEDYVECHKNANLKEFKIARMSVNKGTVANLNNALDFCSGEYIIVFGGDDTLYDEDTLSNFVDVFNKNDKDTLIVAGQAYMYDHKLKKVQSTFVDESLAYINNEVSPIELYQQLIYSVMYAMGATAFKKEIFEKYGKFNEKYKMVEDWSYLLSVSRQGEKVIFNDFGALKHRDGGVSHHNDSHIPKHVLEYYNDLLLIQEFEILPHIAALSMNEQINIFNKYEREKESLGEILENHRFPNERLAKTTILRQNPKLLFRLIIRRVTEISIKKANILILGFLLLTIIGFVLDIIKVTNSGGGFNYLLWSAIINPLTIIILVIMVLTNGLKWAFLLKKQIKNILRR